MDIDEQVETEETTEEAVDISSEINLDTLTLDKIDMSKSGLTESESETEEEVIDSTEDQSEETDTTDSQDQTEDEETSDSTTEDEQTDEGGTSSETEDTTTSEEEVSEETNTEEEFYPAISEETGLALNTYEDLVGALKEASALKTKGETQPELSAAIQKAIEVEKAGGNLSEHFARTGMDFEKMDGRELLRQKFFKDNSKLHGTSPKLANMKFERAYKEQYGAWESYNAISDEEEKSDFVDENGGMEGIEYEKLMLSNDIDEARSELNAWKEEAAPVEVQKPTSDGLTDEQRTQNALDYSEKAKGSLGEFEAVAIDMGEGKKDFNLGLNETTKPMVEGWLFEPHTFLQDIGFDGDKIDTDRLLPIMTLIAEASSGNLGGRIAKGAIDSGDIETLDTKIKKPAKSTSPAIPQDREDGDEWTQIGEAAEKARENAN